MKQFQHKMSLGFIILLSSLGVVLTSCSSDDVQSNDGRKLRQLTISDVPITRATLTPIPVNNPTSLGAAWNANDVATYFNLTTFPTDLKYGNLTTFTSGVSSTFTGTVYCGEGDQLAFFYPAVEIKRNNDTDDIPLYNRGDYVINLDGQKGTLADVAQNYHYIYGVANVTSLNADESANATISTMNSLLALCKFNFTDGENVIPVKKLEISYYAYGAPMDYPQKATVTPSATENVIANPEEQGRWEKPLTIDFNSETSDGVYVALLPYINGSFDHMYFSVTTAGNITYTGSSQAKLKAGVFYPVTLTLTQTH